MTKVYRERDYGFGRVMLTLRTAIGLTQAGLGDRLGVSRRAVEEWEVGSSYPRIDHLKEFIALAVQQQAFPVGHETEEIRALWKAAHQKVLLDEHWLCALLDQQPSAPPLLQRLKTKETLTTTEFDQRVVDQQMADWHEFLGDRTPCLTLMNNNQK